MTLNYANENEEQLLGRISTEQYNRHAILYFAWEDQSEKVCCIAHKVVINCITVLYEPYSTVMRLIGHLQHCYAFN